MSGEAPKRKFAPKAIGRRSKEDRESSAPAIKTEPKENPSRSQFQQGPRKKKGIKGEYLNEAEGALAAPSLADTRRSARNIGSSGFSRASTGAARSTHTERPESTASLVYDKNIDVATPANPLMPQVVSKTPLGGEDSVSFLPDQLCLMNLQPINSMKNDRADDKADDSAMEVDAPLSGRLGTLRRHKSGRTTLLVNDKVYDVEVGATSQSVHDAVLLDGGRAYKLGNVNERAVVVPQF